MLLPPHRLHRNLRTVQQSPPQRQIVAFDLEDVRGLRHHPIRRLELLALQPPPDSQYLIWR